MLYGKTVDYTTDLLLDKYFKSQKRPCAFFESPTHMSMINFIRDLSFIYLFHEVNLR